jgi:DNA-binding response OmpR family regulator
VKGKILVVDDEPDILNLVKIILTKDGYEVLTASTISEFYKLFESAPPHLILLDDIMPVKNGIEICRDLKSNSQTANIPVIIFSASGSTEKRNEAFEAGAEEFLVKPFSIQELSYIVNKHYSLNK